MINLLPPQKKSAIVYGRYNARILRWLTLIVIALLGLAIVMLGSLFYIKQDMRSHEVSIESSKKSLNEQGEQNILKQASDISGRLTLVENVLSKEVVFSKLLPHIGSLIPDGAMLNSLVLSRDTQNAIDLSISAKDFETASQTLTNIRSSDSLLFEEADANSVTCNDTENKGYPCIASIRATIVADNPFLLLNEEQSNE